MKNIKINKKGEKNTKMNELAHIKFIIEFIIAVTLGLSAIIILFKIIFNIIAVILNITAATRRGRVANPA